MKRVGIIGASGYTGAELARILCNHPEVELTVATSRQYAGQPLARVFPSLQGKTALICEDVALDGIVERADLFFTAVPHKTAMGIVPQLLAAGRKVVDLSADFRIHDAAVYEQWYQPHSAREYLPEAIYGLPEIHRVQIKQARLVANPGCYPTSIILALAPLLKEGLIRPETIIADSKSGASGAGRAAQTGTLFCEVADGFRAYKVAAHRHTPEIEQELGLLAGQPLTISFTPHLVPMSRGIFSTVYAAAGRPCTNDELHDLYRTFYSNEHFVRVCDRDQLPATQYVRGSNYCDLAPRYDARTGRIIVLAVIDNIMKGASGQAVQNMNLMAGFGEQTGLASAPLFP